MNFFSTLWTVKMSDWQRGLVCFVWGAIFDLIIEAVKKGITKVDLVNIGTAALIAGLSYIGKNFVTGSGGKILTNAQPTTEVKP
jgi:hypothetical protein